MMPLIYATDIIGLIWATGMLWAMWAHGARGDQRTVAGLDRWIIKPGALALATAFVLLVVVGFARIIAGAPA